MKNITFSLIVFISINCISQNNKNSDYSTYSISELTAKKTSLELDANYVLVNAYLEHNDRGAVEHIAITKLDKGLLNSYWNTVPELKTLYEDYKTAKNAYSNFETTNAPELVELQKNFKNQSDIEKQEYFKKYREIRAEFLVKFPVVYPKLSENQILTLNKMWSQTGRYILEDYKKKEMLFPVNWLPEDERLNLEKDKKYKAISKELVAVQKEIKKKS